MFKLQKRSSVGVGGGMAGGGGFQRTESGGRKAGGGVGGRGKSPGLMGRGKFHHRGGGIVGGGGGGVGGGVGGRGIDDHDGGVLTMDPDGPYRTHLLFPGRKDEEGDFVGRGRATGSPSFMKQMLTWGRKTDPKARAMTPEPSPNDPFAYRNKQVSFMNDGADARYLFERPPERRPNSYQTDTNSSQRGKYFAPFSEPFRESDFISQPGTRGPSVGPGGVGRGVGPAGPSSSGKRASASGGPQDGLKPVSGVSGLLAAVGGQAAAAATGGNLTRAPACDPFAMNGGVPTATARRRRGRRTESSEADEDINRRPTDIHTLNKDCFIIPQGHLERFLPDGITLPREPRRTSLINILELEDPKLSITFHLMSRLSSLTPHLDSPLSAPGELQRGLAQEALDCSRGLQATEGFLLKNLEKDSEYPFINYYVIQKSSGECLDFFREYRSRAYDMFNPSKVGYKSDHELDLFEEMATIARPPVEPLSKCPVADSTGYIVCVYKVFKGDDNEKFERNWLYWSGARMLYKNLPKTVGLRRITIHKSSSTPGGGVTYLLLVECTQFMDHIGEAANLLPILRARICGYTGIYRVTNSF